MWRTGALPAIDNNDAYAQIPSFLGDLTKARAHASRVGRTARRARPTAISASS